MNNNVAKMMKKKLLHDRSLSVSVIPFVLFVILSFINIITNAKVEKIIMLVELFTLIYVVKDIIPYIVTRYITYVVATAYCMLAVIMNDSGYGVIFGYSMLMVMLIISKETALTRKQHDILNYTVLIALVALFIIFSKRNGSHFVSIIDGQELNPNTMGLWVFTMAFMLHTIILDRCNRRWLSILLNLIVIAMTFVLIYNTSARSSFGAYGLYLMCIVVHFLYKAIWHKKYSRRFYGRTMLIAIGCSFLLVFGYIVLYALDVEGIKFFDKSFFTGREKIWYNALGAYFNRPLFGFTNHIFEETGKYYNLHNVYITMMCNLSLVGLVFYMLLQYDTLIKKSDQRMIDVKYFALIAFVFSATFESLLIDTDYLFLLLPFFMNREKIEPKMIYTKDAEKVRVMHAVGCMDMGGIETFLMNVFRNIDRNKFDFTFACATNKDGVYDDEIRSLGGKIVRMPTIGSKNPIKVIKNIAARKKFFMDNNDYDVCHIHVSTAVEAYPRARHALKAGIKTVIVHSHSTKGTNARVNRIFAWLLRRLNIKRFACSEEAAEWMFGTSQNVVVVNNAIELDKFYFNEDDRKAIREEFGISDSTKLIGHVGRFTYAKNHDFLLDVFKSYLDNNDDAILMLVGVGNLEGDIKAKAKSLDIEDKVIFAGLRNDVYRVLQAFDIFVFPSHFEGLSVAYVEAAVSGLPVLIAENIPYVNLSNYIERLPLGDSKVWADKIEDMLRLDRNEVEFTNIKNNYDIKHTVMVLGDIYSGR